MLLKNLPCRILIFVINCSGPLEYELNVTPDSSDTAAVNDAQLYNTMREVIQCCQYPICFISCHQSNIICTHMRDKHPILF